MTYERITARARRRMRLVLKRRRAGQTLEKIGRELKVTRERVRQIENLARFFEEKGIL